MMIPVRSIRSSAIKGRQGQDARRGVAARVGDQVGRRDRVAVQLGQAVDGLGEARRGRCGCGRTSRRRPGGPSAGNRRSGRSPGRPGPETRDDCQARGVRQAQERHLGDGRPPGRRRTARRPGRSGRPGSGGAHRPCGASSCREVATVIRRPGMVQQDPDQLPGAHIPRPPRSPHPSCHCDLRVRLTMRRPRPERTPATTRPATPAPRRSARSDVPAAILQMQRPLPRPGNRDRLASPSRDLEDLSSAGLLARRARPVGPPLGVGKLERRPATAGSASTSTSTSSSLRPARIAERQRRRRPKRSERPQRVRPSGSRIVASRPVVKGTSHARAGSRSGRQRANVRPMVRARRPSPSRRASPPGPGRDRLGVRPAGQGRTQVEPIDSRAGRARGDARRPSARRALGSPDSSSRDAARAIWSKPPVRGQVERPVGRDRRPRRRPSAGSGGVDVRVPRGSRASRARTGL